MPIKKKSYLIDWKLLKKTKLRNLLHKNKIFIYIIRFQGWHTNHGPGRAYKSVIGEHTNQGYMKAYKHYKRLCNLVSVVLANSNKWLFQGYDKP
jgi:hypothetical protein